jgi:hypothetical protein
MVPWQTPGTVADRNRTNDQELVNGKEFSGFHPPWPHGSQTPEETVPLVQKLFTGGRSTHLSPTIQKPGDQNQDFSAETEEIELVDQINSEQTWVIDGGSTLNDASAIERRIPGRLILHTSPKKQRDSRSSIPSEILESGGSGIDKMQLDGDSGCVEDASPDNEPASGSEYTASENL